MSDSIDRALTRRAADEERARANDDQRAWAMDEARRLVERYSRTLELAGVRSLKVVSPTYRRLDKQVRTGGWFSSSVNDEHSWSRSDETIGQGWPTMPILGLKQVIFDRSTYRNDHIPGQVSLPVVVYCRGRLLSAVVDRARKSNELDVGGEKAFNEMQSATKVLIEPKALGEPCSDGACGLPLWVSWQATGLPDQSEVHPSELRMRSQSEEIDEGPGRGHVVQAPLGRGDDAWEWFLARPFQVLDDNSSGSD